jgi:hypothetical protein
MKQAIHILLKDVKLLWLEICVSLALLIVFVCTVISGADSASYLATGDNLASSLLTYLVPVMWVLLVANLVFNEPLAGNGHFWLTWPYSRRSLLTAKVLFILLFINVPILISHVVILAKFGFGAEFGSVLWNQVLLFFWLELPIMALCALTSGLIEFLMAAVIAGLLVAIAELASSRLIHELPWLGIDWIKSSLVHSMIAAASICAIWVQYMTRKVRMARAIGLSAAVASFLAMLIFPWNAAFALQSKFAPRGGGGEPKLQIRLDSTDMPCARSDDSETVLSIPVQVTESPGAMKFRIDGVSASIVTRNGQWNVPTRPTDSENGSGFLRISANSAIYAAIQQGSTRIKGTAYFTLYGNERDTYLPFDQKPTTLHPVAGVGLCSTIRSPRGSIVSCRSAYRVPSGLISLDFYGRDRRGAMMSFLHLSYDVAALSYAAFPPEFILNPILLSTRYGEITGQVDGVRVRAIEPVAHFARDFDVTVESFKTCAGTGLARAPSL